MTFSIVARCADTGMFGVSVSSSSPAVTARCAFARAGVGAIASQNITDPTLGPLGLDLMAEGASAEQALATLCDSSELIGYRQLMIIGNDGGPSVFSGAKTLGTYGDATGAGVGCAGNLLSNPKVPQAMVDAFELADGHLGDRLLVAMQAALDAGGEEGPVHSIGMMLTDKVSWPVADLRIDWTDGDPVAELRSLWEIYKPQMNDYVTRALDPASSPSYGVPGDD